MPRHLLDYKSLKVFLAIEQITVTHGQTPVKDRLVWAARNQFCEQNHQAAVESSQYSLSIKCSSLSEFSTFQQRPLSFCLLLLMYLQRPNMSQIYNGNLLVV